MIECPEYLPIGSVVCLKGSDKTLMVVGRALLFEKEDGTKEYYDYSLVPYPEGLIRDTVIYTQHEQICEVLHEGFSNKENDGIVALMKDIIPKMDVPRANPQPIDTW